MPMFFRTCRHRFTKSAKWGAFDTVPLPLSASGASAPGRLRRLCSAIATQCYDAVAWVTDRTPKQWKNLSRQSSEFCFIIPGLRGVIFGKIGQLKNERRRSVVQLRAAIHAAGDDQLIFVPTVCAITCHAELWQALQHIFSYRLFTVNQLHYLLYL